MVLKNILSYLVFIAFLICAPIKIMADDPPQDPVIEESETVEAEGDRYSLEEFDGLSDDEKRDIYFNSPQVLPDGFDPTDYWDVIHEEQNP